MKFLLKLDMASAGNSCWQPITVPPRVHEMRWCSRRWRHIRYFQELGKCWQQYHLSTWNHPLLLV